MLACICNTSAGERKRQADACGSLAKNAVDGSWGATAKGVLWPPYTLSCMSLSVLTRQINKCNCLESRAIEMVTLSAGGKRCAGMNVSCLSVSSRKSIQLEEAGHDLETDLGISKCPCKCGDNESNRFWMVWGQVITDLWEPRWECCGDQIPPCLYDFPSQRLKTILMSLCCRILL